MLLYILLAVDVRLVLHPLRLDATVLSVHVALRSGDDLDSVKELALHPMDATVASVSSSFSTYFTSTSFGCYCTIGTRL